MKYRVYIGWDPNEMMAWNVAAASMQAGCAHNADIHRLALGELRAKGLYVRPTSLTTEGVLWDDISGAPMSTEHALSRFLIPHLVGYAGWALFVDGDVLVRGDIGDLFEGADPRYAVQVVQHPPVLTEGTKKDGQPQQAYPRKLWSSVLLFNAGHPANARLTPDVVNTWVGRDLHAFQWLSDDQIGELPASWNHLVGVVPHDPDAKIVHYTLGIPTIAGHEDDPFAEDWFAHAKICGYDVPALGKVGV